MTDAFTAAYMEACKDRPADHNEIGLWYFRKGWEAASKSARESYDQGHEVGWNQGFDIAESRARPAVADTPVER
jgi:hypothetical protein